MRPHFQFSQLTAFCWQTFLFFFSNLFCISLGKLFSFFCFFFLFCCSCPNEACEILFNALGSPGLWRCVVMAGDGGGGLGCQLPDGGWMGSSTTSCVFTDIFATLLGQAEMKWARPTTSCSKAHTYTHRHTHTHVQTAAPSRLPSRPTSPLCTQSIVHAGFS